VPKYKIATNRKSKYNQDVQR